jgi:hypothetical protein
MTISTFGQAQSNDRLASTGLATTAVAGRFHERGTKRGAR